MKCYSCDTELLNEWNYCPNCKKVLRKHKIGIEQLVPCNETGKCHQCSCILDSNWNFCPICSDPVDFYENSNVNMAIPAVGSSSRLQIENNTAKELTVDEKPEYEIVGYCMHCGTPLGEGHLFCAVCGAATQQQVVGGVANNETNAVQKKQDRPGHGYILLLILWAICQFGPIIVYLIDKKYIGLSVFFPGALVSILLAKWLYPNNKIVHGVFILYIIITIICLLAFVIVAFLFFYSCYSCLNQLGG